MQDEYFRSGVEPEDIPALFPLLRARESLAAFTALFRGSDDDVLVRLLVLREIGQRGEQPLWSPQELNSHFAYLDGVKLKTVLHRLRDTDLLVWNSETSLYQISPHGRMALSALSMLLRFADEDGGEIGYITSQLAAGQALGKVADEDLHHLLSRLIELEDEFNRAVLSGSELRILRAERKLSSVLSWVEKGTGVMKIIAADPDLDPPTHRAAQKIGQVQSRMLRMSSVFQRTLNQLERQKIHLGQSGLSTSDIHGWLRGMSLDALCTLMDGTLELPTKLGCLLGDVALDVAEFELLERLREVEADHTLPPPHDAPTAGSMPRNEEDLTRLLGFLNDLKRIEAKTPLHDLVPVEDFAVSSYRMSLASLLGDPESGAIDGAVADLARLPLTLHLTGEQVQIGRYGVESMSVGTLEPQQRAIGMEDHDG